jgi:hypothetical protein
MMAILAEVRWNLSVVLACISFIARDGTHDLFEAQVFHAMRKFNTEGESFP